jgi:hypothetical protein
VRARAVGLTTLAAACLVVAATTASGQDTLLVAGSELVYESNGQRNTWRVELVERGIARGGWTGCLRVRFAPGGPRATADDRVTCEVDGVLHAWDSTASRWRATRPTRADSYLELPGRTTLSEYRTGAERVETIGGTPVRVVETTVITTDSAGRQVRRLRERYAPALGTATWGVFEVPNPAADGGWRVQVEFTLVEIRRP